MNKHRESILREANEGKSVVELAKKYNVSANTIYNWKSEEKKALKIAKKALQPFDHDLQNLAVRYAKLREMYVELALDARLKKD